MNLNPINMHMSTYWPSLENKKQRGKNKNNNKIIILRSQL